MHNFIMRFLTVSGDSPLWINIVLLVVTLIVFILAAISLKNDILFYW